MRSRSSELEIIDGFGDSPTASNHVANGADADSDGLLEDGEFLINCNGNGSVATGSGDDFDNRSAGEKADTAVTDSVFSDVASSGSKWTDISLSTSFSSPDFPDTGGTGMPSEPIFIFDFTVLKTDITFGADIFFNLLFGDYDVSPADINLLFPVTGTASRSVALTLRAGNEDGLIQAAFPARSLSPRCSPTVEQPGMVPSGLSSMHQMSPIRHSTTLNSARRRFCLFPNPPPSCCSSSA